jgi:predicted nucleotidyltransferase component of viral defense system
MLEAMPGGMAFAVRDFALVTLAGQLAASFPDQLVFKGGFVLRHALGHLRFSKDVDATRHTPPQHKLDAAEVADAIRAASIHNFVQCAPEDPATDSARGLDFDKVHVTGPDLPDSNVQVEVSYREEVIGDPVPFAIGGPFYEPFEILTMAVEEMVSEKLRALAQRLRATDLADLAVMLRSDVDDAEIARFAEEKFKLVKQGKANGIERIERNLDDLAETYDDAVPGLFPDAPGYGEAREIVWPRIKSLVP